MRQDKKLKNIPTLVKDSSLVQKRRDEIVEAAVNLFVEKGYHPTTTREIARAAGFSIGTLYEYIESKEDVLYLVCEAIHREMEAQLLETAVGSESALTRLKGAIAAYFEVCDRMQDEILLVYQESGSLAEESLKFVLANDIRIAGIFEKILEQGLSEGSLMLKKGSTASLVAHNIVVLGHMWAFRRWFLQRRFSLDDYVAVQTSLIVNELNPPDPN